MKTQNQPSGKSKLSFSKWHLLVFAAVFALIGGYIIYRALATYGLSASGSIRQTNSTCNVGSGFNGGQSGNSFQCVFSYDVHYPGATISLTYLYNTNNGTAGGCMYIDGASHCNDTGSIVFSNVSQSVGAHLLVVSWSPEFPNQSGPFTLSGTVNEQIPTPPPPPQPPTVNLTANPSTINSGQSSTLSWSSTNATSCAASGAWSGNKPTSGSQSTGTLNSTRTYTLTCSGAGGSANDSATVTVIPPGPGPPQPPPQPPPPPGGSPPGLTFSASPRSVAHRGSSTLSWSSSRANSCSASGAWNGSKPRSGSQAVGPLTSTSRFTLTCSNNYGRIVKSVTVAVAAAPGLPIPPPPPEEEPVVEIFEEPLIEEPVELQQEPKSKWNIWSLIIGGLIGWGIDVAKE